MMTAAEASLCEASFTVPPNRQQTISAFDQPYTWIKTSLLASSLAITFLGAILYAETNDTFFEMVYRIKILVRGVFIVTLVCLYWRYLVEEG